MGTLYIGTFLFVLRDTNCWTMSCSFFDYVLLEHGVQPHKIIVTALSLKMDFPILALTFMDLGFWQRTEELDSWFSIIGLVSVRKPMWWKTNWGNTGFDCGQARRPNINWPTSPIPAISLDYSNNKHSLRTVILEKWLPSDSSFFPSLLLVNITHKLLNSEVVCYSKNL